MKAIKMNSGIALIALLFLFISIPQSNANENLKPTKKLQTKIIKMIQSPDLAKYGIEKEEVHLTFIINQESEIEVTNVIAESDYLEQFVKAKLNNKRIKISDVEVFKAYNLKITFTAS